MRRIVSCYFPGGGSGDRWPRMVRVLAHTARVHCPEWEIAISPIAPPRIRLGESENQVVNTAKLEHWCHVVRESADDDELLLIDADTFIAKPLNDAWSQPFDVAYTVRAPGYPMPLNGGVIFVRVSPKVRYFMHWWQSINSEMRRDRALADRYKQHVGMNQRALAHMLEASGRLSVLDAPDVLPLPCLEWNCEDSTWKAFDPAVTRIVHVKSDLRAAVFARPNAPIRPHLRALATRWHALEHEALQLEAGRP